MIRSFIKLCLLLTVAVWVSAAYAQTTPIELDGVVYQTANLRVGPDTRFDIVDQLPANTAVVITGRDAPARWLLVVTADENEITGWLPAYVVALEGDVTALPIADETVAPDAETGAEADAEATDVPEGSEVSVVAYGRTNVRAEPSISAEIIGQLDLGSRVPALARNNSNNDWLFIALNDNESDETMGWVAYFTVLVEGEADTLPILVPNYSGEALIAPSQIITVRFNARLHPEPTLDSPTLVIVPFGEEVTVIARSEDSRWLYVGYQTTTAWGSAGLFNLDEEDIGALPVYLPEDALPDAAL